MKDESQLRLETKVTRLENEVKKLRQIIFELTKIINSTFVNLNVEHCYGSSWGEECDWYELRGNCNFDYEKIENMLKNEEEN